MITAYGFSRSGNCWKVRTSLELTRTPFSWVEVDTNGDGEIDEEYVAEDEQAFDGRE